MDRRRLVLAAAALVVAVMWALTLQGGSNELTLTFLDVGQGLCTVMRTPSGKTLVMDCGTSTWRDSDAVGRKVTAPYLQSLGVDSIDVAVLSHPHSDHVSGYAGLLRSKPAGLVLDIGAGHGSPQYKDFLEAAKETGATYRTAKRGQSIDMGDGVSVQVLSPDPAITYTDLNNRSIVVRVTYGSVAILLAADAGIEAEESMLAAKCNLRSQVLQVGHHGGDTATSPAWLAAVQPQIAVVSCGRGNEYGHPSRTVTDRLAAFGSKILRTDKDGAAIVTSDGKTVRIRASR